MTLEELLDCSADKLQAMTNQELEDYFRPYFAVTRPECARRKPSSSQPILSPDMQHKFKLAAEMGIDVASLKKKLGKR